MALLSDHLQHLAAIAAEYWLRSKSDTKNSLMTPLDEIFKKLSHRSPAFDEQALRAVVANDIFEYLRRIAGEGYKPGLRKREGVRQFVNLFFDEVYGAVYRRNLQRLLADERMLRSAFYFYVQDAYARRRAARAASTARAGEPDEDIEDMQT